MKKNILSAVGKFYIDRKQYRLKYYYALEIVSVPANRRFIIRLDGVGHS